MAVDGRLLGSWLDENGISLVKQDPDTGDSLWYLTGPAANYSMPDAETLLYPTNQGRMYKRLDSTSNQTIIGHWRHEIDPAISDDVGEEMIFRKDGFYVDFWDGESLFYSGSYSRIHDSAGMHLSIIEYRIHLQTQGNSYMLEAVWDFSQEGTFAFGITTAGKKSVTFYPFDGAARWRLTEYAGQPVAEAATVGAVRRDAIRKRRGG